MAQAAAQDIPALQQEIQNLKQKIAVLEQEIEDVKQQIVADRGSALPREEQLAGLQRQLDRREELELTLQEQLATLYRRLERQEAAAAAAAGAVAAGCAFTHIVEGGKGGGLDALFAQSLREPLVEMVNELRVTNTYLRNSASMQFNYTSSQATQHRDPNFKRALIETYGCEDPHQPHKLFCLGLGEFVPKQLVCGAHLFKYSWRNVVDKVLGFPNINDPANGLLLIKPLEEAFDNGYMCITWEGRRGDERAQGEYRMLWLGSPDLRVDDTKSYPWKSNDKLPSAAQAQLRELENGPGDPLRFMDFHRKVLTFRTSARPFRRCLVFQARFAAKQAISEGRFNEQQLAEMVPYLAAVSPQASNIAMYWQRMPAEGPDLPLGSAPVEDLVYDHAPESISDAEGD